MELTATWILEVTAALFAVLSLGAMAGVLSYADNQIVLAWHGVTLNTVISILGTSTRVCSMFVLGAAIAQSKWTLFSKSPQSLLEFEAVEQAGRGVSGAVKLLLKTRRVAAIGAIAIILSLAFDPFAQQLVQFKPDILWETNSQVTLPRAQRYSAGNRVPVQLVANLQRGANMTAVFDNADFAMQASIYYGLTKPITNVTQQLSVGCPSGNCTWPVSESLAVCSVCNDVSSQIKKTTAVTPPGYVLLALDAGGAMVSNTTRYTLPNGAWLDNADGMAPGVLMTSLATQNANTTVSLTDLDTLIWASTIMEAHGDMNQSWPAQSVQATECALYYCVKEYTTTVTNSTTSQNFTINTAATRNPDSWQPIETFDSKLNSSDRTNLAFDKTQSKVTRTDLMLGDNYNISQTALDGISNFFQQNFFEPITNIDNVNGFYLVDPVGNPQFQPSSMQPLFASSDLSDTFAAMAESMSNVVRANSDRRLRDIGKGGLPVTRFQVSWPWIALPAVFVLCALSQLLVTIWASRKVPLWKSSTLATMSRGRWLGDVLDEASTVKEMQNIAENVPVHLFSHTAPGGVAAVANSNTFHERMGGKDGTVVQEKEIGASPV